MTSCVFTKRKVVNEIDTLTRKSTKLEAVVGNKILEILSREVKQFFRNLCNIEVLVLLEICAGKHVLLKNSCSINSTGIRFF